MNIKNVMKVSSSMLVAGACAALGGKPTPRYEWQQVTLAAPFAARDGAGALVYKDRMWLIGGWSKRDKTRFPRICNNEVWSSSDGVSWALVKPNTFLDGTFDSAADWEGRHTAGYVVHDGKMWIIGGDCNQGHYQPDAWNSEDGRTWTRVTGNLPWGRRALQLVYSFKGKLWAMGGQTMPGFVKDSPEAFYNDVWCSEDGATWARVLEHAPWSVRGMSSGVVIFKDRLWILGGGTYDTPTTPTRQFYNDVWSTPDGIQWTCHTERAAWHPRQYHEVAVWDDRMWVMEGYHKDGGNRKDVWYSADGVNWTELPETPWKPRHAASLFVYKDALWMVAGNNMEPDVWKLVRRP